MILNQQRSHRRRMPRRPDAGVPPGANVGEIIPYDYGATFEIIGRPGSVAQDVINISPDGAFVAVAIGYSFEEDRARVLGFVPRPQQNGGLPAGSVFPGDLTLGEIPGDALIEGFRVNPPFETHLFASNGQHGNRPVRGDGRFSDQPVPGELLRNNGLFQRVKSVEDISFLFTILDSGSGRELQDEPTHNLASLGKSNGERPFRLLAQPITFLPRSTIRLQIIERSEGLRGRLFIVLYGYKGLGGSSCPEPVARALTGSPACPTETIGSPSRRVIPFDYVTTFELTGRAQNRLESEAAINVEGGFVATSVGYGLFVEETVVTMEWARAAQVKNTAPRGSTTFRDLIQTLANDRQDWLKDPDTIAVPTMNLADLPLRLFPTSALTDGVRIRPDYMRIAFGDNGQLADTLQVTWIDKLFERLNRPEDVSFRYNIFDSGRGRDLQNRPLHNVAGLGIANGDRPFKRLARSMVFLPRSTIRVQVEEIFGRGTLFIVFQGYKFLSASGTGASR
jgi:hypothetical protein